MLAAKVKGKADSPGAVQTGITSEKEGSLASHELDLGDVVVGLLELEHVAQERAIARKKCTGSWVQHGTVMSFVASKICIKITWPCSEWSTVLSVGAVFRFVAPPFGTGQL
jgi:hypothetical protein